MGLYGAVRKRREFWRNTEASEIMTQKATSYPVVDLFAGPGGLGEGLSAVQVNEDCPAFNTVASIEREKFSYQTLLLRHFFRSFRGECVPETYYDYLAGNITQEVMIKGNPVEWHHAKSSALQISLGEETHEQVTKIIKQRLGKAEKWALVGGPPCQAYSLVGRSRMMGDEDFKDDERHFLYKEYLKIIIDHRPPVFVMENVKGLLSAKVNNESVIQKIMNDLSNPVKAINKKNNGLSYRLYSLGTKGEVKEEIDPKTFIIKAEEYGVPQARHRMFIVGIRGDINIQPEILQKSIVPTVKDVIGNMPRIRSGISKGLDSADRWKSVIRDFGKSSWFQNISSSNDQLASVINKCLKPSARLPSRRFSRRYSAPDTMRSWYGDSNIKVLTAHESRSHMETDLHRYLFAAAYSQVQEVSPKLIDFPEELLPKHKNVEEGRRGKMFSDRFRVQVAGRVATTITSHISKDGHYFIHYDPTQCRSLTVREAARLQTFPDNYHFEGPRTSQYHQVGNAVPPYLAVQIAEIIRDVLDRIPGE